MDTKARAGPGSNKNEVTRFVASTGQDGAPDLYSGKRRSTRFSEAVMLEVTLDPEKPAAQSTVYMHNVSDGGFAFWSRKKIVSGTKLFVRECSGDDSSVWLSAQVTHCTFGLRGFLVGASFGKGDPAHTPGAQRPAPTRP